MLSENARGVFDDNGVCCICEHGMARGSTLNIVL